MKISLTFQKCKGKMITENVFLFSLSSVLPVVCFCHDYSHFFQRRPAVWTLWVGSRERNGRIASSFLKANVGGIQAAQTLDINSDGSENIWSNRLPLVTRIREFISFLPPLNVYTYGRIFQLPEKTFISPRKIRVLILCRVYSTAKKSCRWKEALWLPSGPFQSIQACFIVRAHSFCKLFIK